MVLRPGRWQTPGRRGDDREGGRAVRSVFRRIPRGRRPAVAAPDRGALRERGVRRRDGEGLHNQVTTTGSNMRARRILIAAACVFGAASLSAQTPFHAVTRQVNQRLVKVFGSGGFRGLAAYGTGIVVSPDGYVLTVASHLLETPELKIHLFDGRRCSARLVVTEPELDAALLKIDKVEGLPYF